MRGMSTPQQPELHRSQRGDSDPNMAAKSDVSAETKAPAGDGGVAPVPEDNQPGHHPEQEQDKPDIPR